MQDLAAYSETTIRQGSKSFAKAAMLFDAETRASVMMLYAWCRHCDDVIDGQALGHGLQALTPEQKLLQLGLLRQETERVCAGHGSDIPAFAALQQVVRKHGIARRHLFDLLDGFAMDAEEARFITLDDTLRYCYHVAGVVGVMMARIMGAEDEDVIHRASDLGIAFQLTNISRDVMDDLSIGRCYLPEEWLAAKGIPREELQLPAHRDSLHALASELVELAERYYDSARVGIAHLPWRCAWAISSALLIYRDIGLQVRKAGTHAWDGRTQVSGSRKLWRLCHGSVMATHALSRRQSADMAPSRAGLWTRAGNEA
ncbi:phytoene/squalene synthase family protein [Noviherbaspirillum aerium]|uniref:phytoene/squalene synthase family protein n=1 Tax=Noviherbaspirillum aerium TaxID=2588497 RepID=UPI00124D0741|nr:phytoene/squalene synthase family protein [Noviherbaspirillum aerium]